MQTAGCTASQVSLGAYLRCHVRCEVQSYPINESSLFVLFNGNDSKECSFGFVEDETFSFCLDFSVIDSTRKSYGSLRFSIVFGRTLRVEHWQGKECLCLLAAKVCCGIFS